MAPSNSQTFEVVLSTNDILKPPSATMGMWKEKHPWILLVTESQTCKSCWGNCLPSWWKERLDFSEGCDNEDVILFPVWVHRLQVKIPDPGQVLSWGLCASFLIWSLRLSFRRRLTSSLFTEEGNEMTCPRSHGYGDTAGFDSQSSEFNIHSPNSFGALLFILLHLC